MQLTNDKSALAYASRVIADLVRDGAAEYESWTLDVKENDRVVDALRIP